MTSAFDNLTGPGKPLRADPPGSKEFAGLHRMGLARLKDAQRSGLALESQFDLAYNAAHALCLAALRWHGYRSGNRFIVFQLLPHTQLTYLPFLEMADERIQPPYNQASIVPAAYAWQTALVDADV